MDELLQAVNPFGEKVFLTEKVWQEILLKHPEVKNLLPEMERTISQPDFIKESIYDLRTKLYYRFHANIFDGKLYG